MTYGDPCCKLTDMTKPIHAVGVIFENGDGQILVLRRHAERPEGGTWGLVGGKIEPGEDPASAAIREVQEEIGHNLDKNKLEPLSAYEWEYAGQPLLFNVFRTNEVPKDVETKLDQTENTEHMWAAPESLHERPDLMSGLYPILEDTYGVKHT